jgi:DNA-binding SARP family transcriptional activator
MRIAVLGPLEVRDDTGEPIAVPGGKERLLLAVLAADAGRVVPTDRLVRALWNGDEPVTARKSLQIHVVRLRTALEPGRSRGVDGGHVVRSGGGYAPRVERDDVDAGRASDLVARGRARLASDEPADSVSLLTEALALWRGTPYGDWPDVTFAEAERRRLGEVRSGVLLALLEARLALGQQIDVVPEAERLVSEDPLREESWRLLVLALYRSGRQAEALAAAASARRVLRDEVGADPGPALRAMEAAVLAQDPSLDLPGMDDVRAARTVACPWLMGGTSTRRPPIRSFRSWSADSRGPGAGGVVAAVLAEDPALDSRLSTALCRPRPGGRGRQLEEPRRLGVRRRRARSRPRPPARRRTRTR